MPRDPAVTLTAMAGRGGAFGERALLEAGDFRLEDSGLTVKDPRWETVDLWGRFGWGFERHLTVNGARPISDSDTTFQFAISANYPASEVPVAGDILCLDLTAPPARVGACEVVLVLSQNKVSSTLVTIDVVRWVAGMGPFSGNLSSANVELVTPPDDLESVCVILARRIADQEQRAIASDDMVSGRGLLYDLTRRLAPYRRRTWA